MSLNAPSHDLQLENQQRHDKRLLISSEAVRLNVAQNWTQSVKKSSGKYLWLIGDDDFIISEQLTKVLEILKDEKTDCLTFNGWSYIFPSGLTKNKALSRERHFHYKKSLLGVLNPAQREKIILNMYRFIPLIPLNMQLTIFSRRVFEEIGDCFQMPFPDHIALMELLGTAPVWRIIDDRLCIVGMAPTSFGNSAYLNSDSVGESYLGLTESSVPPMPGNILNSVMLSWLEALSTSNPRFKKYKPSRGNYVLRQLGVSYRRWRSGDLSFERFFKNLVSQQFADLIRALIALLSLHNLRLIVKILRRKPGPEKIIGSKFIEISEHDIANYARTLDFGAN